MAAVLVMLSAGWSQAAPPTVIVADRYVAPDGTLRSGAAIVIEDGRIRAVEPADEHAWSGNVIRYNKGVVSPGLIDVLSAAGAYNKREETAKAIDPAPSAVDVVDPRHRDFQTALESGVTSVMIAPSPTNLVCGAAVTVKTAAVDQQRRIIREDGPLTFALGSGVFVFARAPTSRIGSLAMLRGAIKRARDGDGHERLQAFADGRLDGFVFCETAADVSAGLRTLAGSGRRLSFVYNGDELSLADELKDTGHVVVLGPYSVSSLPRSLAMAGTLDAAGVPVAIAGGMPQAPAASLRLGASLAVRYGMDAAAARRAITGMPARVAGVGDRVGAIRAGQDADLVVFSDDPLRLDARVLDVFIYGKRVYHANAQVDSKRGDDP